MSNVLELDSKYQDTESFKVGDRVRVPKSGWTGVVVEKSKVRSNGYKVRWDSKTYESWVRPLNLEKVK